MKDAKRWILSLLRKARSYLRRTLDPARYLPGDPSDEKIALHSGEITYLMKNGRS